jgi:hypothetical protein
MLSVSRRSPRTPFPRSPPDEQTLIFERGEISSRRKVWRKAISAQPLSRSLWPFQHGLAFREEELSPEVLVGDRAAGSRGDGSLPASGLTAFANGHANLKRAFDSGKRRIAA